VLCITVYAIDFAGTQCAYPQSGSQTQLSSMAGIFQDGLPANGWQPIPVLNKPVTSLAETNAPLPHPSDIKTGKVILLNLASGTGELMEFVHNEEKMRYNGLID